MNQRVPKSEKNGIKGTGGNVGVGEFLREDGTSLDRIPWQGIRRGVGRERGSESGGEMGRK